jgi:hypothetical protein
MRAAIWPGDQAQARVRPITAAGLLAGLAAVYSVGLTALAAPAGASGAILYVAQGGSDSGDCSSPVSPCATVSYALTQAAAGATIEVSGTIDDNVTLTFPVTITGAFAPAASPAVLDGTASGTVVTVSGATVALKDLSIVNGRGRGDSGSGAVDGGGIFNTGSLTLGKSTVSGNTANGRGGGIFNGGSLTVARSTISGNTAMYGGGIRNDPSGSLRITDSTISGNSGEPAFGEGGGVDNYGTATVTDSTISGNTVNGCGGGIYNLSAAITLTGDTVAGNSAPCGGGIYTRSDAHPATVTVGATIVAANKGGNCFAVSAITSVGYNLTNAATGSGCGLTEPTDLVNASPGLGPLAGNGGPTQTRLPGAAGPAAGVIPQSTTLNGVTVCPRHDQRGIPGPPPGRADCAIGAVEPVLNWTGAPIAGFPRAGAGDARGFHLGKSGNAWRLIVTQPQRALTVFSGTITINSGSFTGVAPINLEPGDTFSTTGATITFRFKNHGKPDGISFVTPAQATRITFHLTIGARPASPSQVYLGSAGTNATGSPLTLART